MTAALTWTRWTAALLVVSALLFAAAVLAEGNTHRESVAVAHSEATEQGEPHDQAAEAEEHSETGEEAHANDEAPEADVHLDESLFGIDLENPVIVWGFVLVSFALAAVVFANIRPALLVSVAVGGLAALLDGREVVLQWAENNAGVAALAGATAIAHVAVAIVAVLAWRAGTTQTQIVRN